MREIKFRGKRLDNGEWVYGTPRNEGGRSFILDDNYSVLIDPPEYHYQGMGCGIEDRGITDRYEACEYGWDKAIERYEEQLPVWIEVDPKTVGQYTGLKDKNGREIFEGDIVEAKDPYKYNSKEIFYTCEVVFTEGAAFMLKHTYENWGTVGIRYFGLRDMELEVIGNIYDNPELLEVEK